MLTGALIIGLLSAVAAIFVSRSKAQADTSIKAPQAAERAPQLDIPAGDLGAALEAALREFDKRKIRMRDQLRPPANDAQIAAFEARVGQSLPEDAKALYRITNGQKSPSKVTYRTGAPNIIELPFALKPDEYVGNLFGSYEFLSLDEMAKAWEDNQVMITQSSAAELEDFDDHVDVRPGDFVRKHYVHSKWLPFALDGGGNSYAFDLDPLPGGRVGQIIVIGPDEDTRRVIAPDLTGLFSMIAKKGIEEDDGDDQRFFFSVE